MSNVVNTNDQSINPSNSKVDHLDKLAHDLQQKKSSLDATETRQIEMIDAALSKVNEERQKADPGLNQKIANNQARLGQYNQVKPAIKTETTKQVQGIISNEEAEKIVAIKSVQGAVLKPGQKFASMSGKEPSNISYMKTNIQGLFDLVDLKDQAVA